MDPIFWLHHANIDRLWEVWTIGGGTNPTLKVWLDRSFRLRAADRRSARMKPATCSTPSVRLDYTYESLPVRARAQREAGGRCPRKSAQPLLIGTNDDPVEVEPRRREHLDRRHAAARIRWRPLPGSAPAYLNVTDIEGGRNPGIVYGVYLNLPAGPRRTPATTTWPGCVVLRDRDRPGRHAAGDGRTAGMRYSFDVTDLVDRLRAPAHGSRIGCPSRCCPRRTSWSRNRNPSPRARKPRSGSALSVCIRGEPGAGCAGCRAGEDAGIPRPLARRPEAVPLAATAFAWVALLAISPLGWWMLRGADPADVGHTGHGGVFTPSGLAMLALMTTAMMAPLAIPGVRTVAFTR